MKTAAVVAVAIAAIALAVYLAIDIQRNAESHVELQARSQDELLAFEAAQQLGATIDVRQHHLQILALRFMLRPQIVPDEVIRTYTTEETITDDHAAFIDARGIVVRSTDPADTGRDMSRTDLFVRAMASDGSDAIVAFEPAVRPANAQEFNLLLGMPIRSKGSSVPSGVVTVTISVPQLVENLAGEGRRQNVTLIAADGTILYQSRIPANVTEKISAPPARCYKCHQSVNFLHAIQDSRRGSILHSESGRHQQMLAYSTFNFGGKPMLLVLSHDEVTSAFVRETSVETVLLILVVALVVIAAAIVIFRANRRRLQAADEARRWREQSALESALRTAERHYRTIVETSHDLIWMLDDEGRFTFANLRTEEATGYSADELFGKNFSDLLVAVDPGLDAVITGATDVTSVNSEIRLRTKNGGTVILEVASVVTGEVDTPRLVICSARDITSRREAEKTLTRTQRDYQQLVDSIPGIVWRANAKTFEFDVASGQARDILGYDPKEWTSNATFWTDHLHPDDRKWAPDFCAAQARIGAKHDFDYRMIAADGRVVWLHDVVNVQMEDGEPKTLSGVMIDVTASKTAELRVRESEERFRAIFEQSAFGIALRDAEGRMLETNPAIPRMLGYEVDEIVHLEPGALAHPDDKEHVTSVLRELWSEEGQAQTFQRRYRRKDGSYMWARVTMSLIRDENGRPKMSVGIIEDISERLFATRERTRLATAIEHAGEAVVVTDAGGRIEYVNPAFEAITGYSRQEVVGRTPSILKSGQHDGEFYGAMWNQITRGETWAGRLVNRRKDGSFYEAEATISPMFEPSGLISGYVAVQRDVTEHVALLEKLRRAEEMQALGRLVSGVAHEVRNPLGAIQAALSALELDLGDVPEHAPFFSIIRSQVDRLTRLMRDLLDLGKPLQEARTSVQSIAEICEGSIAVWRHSNPNESPSRVVFTCGSRDSRVKIDPLRIQQVIINLLDNATQHSAHDSPIAITIEESGDTCRIRVRDAGTGIENAAINRIFDPFFTTRKGGTGLGLSLVRNIVEQHGGRISVYNNDPPPGATAEVTLPIVRTPVGAAV